MLALTSLSLASFPPLCLSPSVLLPSLFISFSPFPPFRFFLLINLTFLSFLTFLFFSVFLFSFLFPHLLLSFFLIQLCDSLLPFLSFLLSFPFFSLFVTFPLFSFSWSFVSRPSISFVSFSSFRFPSSF